MIRVTGATIRGLKHAPKHAAACSALGLAVAVLAGAGTVIAQTAPPATPAVPAVATAATPATPSAADSSVAIPPAFPTAPAATATPAAAPVTQPALPAEQTATTQPATAPLPAAPEATGTLTPTLAVPSAPIIPAEVEAARAAIKDAASGRTAHADDVAAASAFYANRQGLVWISEGAYSLPAQSLIAELRKADDYGLEASAFPVVNVTSLATPAEQGAADANLTLAALKYARFARGGRLNPVALSSMLDVQPSIVDPNTALKDITSSATPDLVIRALHPKHPEFEGLRQALIKARGPRQEEAAAIDPALLVKLPPGKILKAGAEHDDVVLLRKRLKVAAADGANERAFSSELADALKSFQEAQGLKPNGQLNSRTRTALNREGEPKTVDPKREIDRLIVNMERWRWLPENLGRFYVMNNVPEYMTRAVKDDAVVFEQRIIVGLPTWPTPMMTDQIERVVFNPEWGVPDGIKVKELLPRLRRASGGGNNFFDQLFGGGSSGGARVLAAYGLKPSYNGRPVDANAVDWNAVDIRRFSFVQPAGSKNPLGRVKFMFPNSHDVYMHDTSSRELFAQSSRALSHGCIRVQNPESFAELLLSEDKGWPADQVAAQYRGGTNDIALTTPVPVYLTYFTARPSKDGGVTTYADIYGTDSRVMSALTGRAVRFDPPSPAADEVSDATLAEEVAPAQKKKNTKKQASRKQSGDGPGDLIQNAFSGLLFN